MVSFTICSVNYFRLNLESIFRHIHRPVLPSNILTQTDSREGAFFSGLVFWEGFLLWAEKRSPARQKNQRKGKQFSNYLQELRASLQCDEQNEGGEYSWRGMWILFYDEKSLTKIRLSREPTMTHFFENISIWLI